MVRRAATQVGRGVLMGSADMVPGVSAGAIAMSFGIYRDLLDALDTGLRAALSAARLDVAGVRHHLRALDWAFVVPLLAGAGVAVLALAGPVAHLLETHPIETAALFLGLVAGSIVMAARFVPTWDRPRLLALGIGATASALLLGLPGLEVADPSPAAFALGGALAITALILPGVSGAFVLLLIGLYEPLLVAVDDRDVASLVAFAAGAGLGLVVTCRGLRWALDRWEATVLAAMVGVMIGSLRLLWPWPDGLEGQPGPAMPTGAPGEVALAVGLAVLGAGLIGGGAALAHRHQRRTGEALEA